MRDQIEESAGMLRLYSYRFRLFCPSCFANQAVPLFCIFVFAFPFSCIHFFVHSRCLLAVKIEATCILRLHSIYNGALPKLR